MNDTPIKRFCAHAHETLLCGVELRMQRCGIVLNDAALSRDDAMGQLALLPREQRQRAELLELQREMGHTALAERVAYTWFNRIVAIRYMEVHDYLPSHIRLFLESSNQMQHLGVVNLVRCSVAQAFARPAVELIVHLQHPPFADIV